MDELGLLDESRTIARGDGPPLRATAVEVDALHIGESEGGGLLQVIGIIAAKLHNQRLIHCTHTPAHTSPLYGQHRLTSTVISAVLC